MKTISAVKKISLNIIVILFTTLAFAQSGQLKGGKLEYETDIDIKGQFQQTLLHKNPGTAYWENVKNGWSFSRTFFFDTAMQSIIIPLNCIDKITKYVKLNAASKTASYLKLESDYSTYAIANAEEGVIGVFNTKSEYDKYKNEYYLKNIMVTDLVNNKPVLNISLEDDTVYSSPQSPIDFWYFSDKRAGKSDACIFVLFKDYTESVNDFYKYRYSMWKYNMATVPPNTIPQIKINPFTPFPDLTVFDEGKGKHTSKFTNVTERDDNASCFFMSFDEGSKSYCGYTQEQRPDIYEKNFWYPNDLISKMTAIESIAKKEELNKVALSPDKKLAVAYHASSYGLDDLRNTLSAYLYNMETNSLVCKLLLPSAKERGLKLKEDTDIRDKDQYGIREVRFSADGKRISVITGYLGNYYGRDLTQAEKELYRETKSVHFSSPYYIKDIDFWTTFNVAAAVK